MLQFLSALTAPGRISTVGCLGYAAVKLQRPAYIDRLLFLLVSALSVTDSLCRYLLFAGAAILHL